MQNKQLPETRVKPPEKGASKDWIRLPAIHGDPNPEGIQKLTHGSADLPVRGTFSKPLVGAPRGNHNHSGGNVPLDYYGPFGWTTSAKVAGWFDKEFDRWRDENRLKLKAMKAFHPIGNYEFRSPSYTLLDNGVNLDQL